MQLKNLQDRKKVVVSLTHIYTERPRDVERSYDCKEPRQISKLYMHDTQENYDLTNYHNISSNTSPLFEPTPLWQKQKSNLNHSVLELNDHESTGKLLKSSSKKHMLFKSIFIDGILFIVELLCSKLYSFCSYS